MIGIDEARLQNDDEIDIKTDLDDILKEYSQAAEAFSNGLMQSSSNYDLMVVKQSYLLDAAGVLKRTSDIFDYPDISLAASFFEAAAWAYLDGSDLQAYYQGLDNRFTLSEECSRFLRSRLTVRATEAKKIKEVCSRELSDTASPRIWALRFMLELILKLPIGSWECAACFAVSGRCKDCGYGRDHEICSRPGSTYEMLSSSREAILKSIRTSLIEACRMPKIGISLPEQSAHFDSPDISSSSQMDVDVCGQFDIVEACD
jgi:hypothetical protein